jgi:hypothetical protein
MDTIDKLAIEKSKNYTDDEFHEAVVKQFGFPCKSFHLISLGDYKVFNLSYKPEDRKPMKNPDLFEIVSTILCTKNGKDFMTEECVFAIKKEHVFVIFRKYE